MGMVDDINNTYSAGVYLDINATASPNYEFIMWEGGTFTDPYSPNTQVLVDGNLEIKAVFTLEIYYINIPTTQEQLVVGWGPYSFNTQANISSSSPEGYKFSHWEKNSEILSLENPYSFTVSEDLNLSASYMPMDYNISINSGNGGTISSVKDENNEDVTKFYHDANYTVTITPDQFYKFKEWSSNTMTNNFPVEISAGLKFGSSVPTPIRLTLQNLN